MPACSIIASVSGANIIAIVSLYRVQYLALSRQQSNVSELIISALYSAQPTTSKSGAPQSLNNVRTATHQPPKKTRAIILDHHDDRPLVQAEVATRNPSLSLPSFERRVVAALESVLVRDLGIVFVETLQ